jgi:hypothetical protein
VDVTDDIVNVRGPAQYTEADVAMHANAHGSSSYLDRALRDAVVAGDASAMAAAAARAIDATTLRAEAVPRPATDAVGAGADGNARPGRRSGKRPLSDPDDPAPTGQGVDGGHRPHAAAATATATATATETLAVTDEWLSAVAARHTDLAPVVKRPRGRAVLAGGSAAARVMRALVDRVLRLEASLADAPRCLVCMDAPERPVVSTACWHIFCEACWLRTLATRRVCPQCNTITAPGDLRRVFL